MPRFVVLTHDHPFLHWDLMLESAGVLRTWRLLQTPDTASEVEAEALADHRLDYLEYEGPVSGGRGSVAHWDEGDYVLISETTGRIELRIQGARLNGRFELVTRTGENRWSFHLLEG